MFVLQVQRVNVSVIDSKLGETQACALESGVWGAYTNRSPLITTATSISRAFRWVVSTKRSSSHRTSSKNITWSRYTTEQMIFTFALHSNPELIPPNSCCVYLKRSSHNLTFTSTWGFFQLAQSSYISTSVKTYTVTSSFTTMKGTHNSMVNIVSSCSSSSESEHWRLSNKSNISKAIKQYTVAMTGHVLK